MNVNNVNLEAVGVKLAQYPTTLMPEIAFAGKSNVGKSSLINCLINRKSLARTSGQPGKTRTINFYNVENLLYFVDLPGYGYAKISKDAKESWGKMIEDYLYNRPTIKMVVLLVDIRHEPNVNDQLMAHWVMSMGYTPLIVATKADKVNRSQLQRHLAVIKKTLKLKNEHLVLPFSNLSRLGKDEIWQAMEAAIAEQPTV